MKTMSLKWSLAQEAAEHTEERYCSNCGRKVVFTDSQMRRQNANGKNIHEYAIFKCPKGHTWNKKLAHYKAESVTAIEGRIDESSPDHVVQAVTFAQLRANGYDQVVIELMAVAGRWRLDRALADQIADCSRAALQRMIADGKIKIDGQRAKCSEMLKAGQHLQLLF